MSLLKEIYLRFPRRGSIAAGIAATAFYLAEYYYHAGNFSFTGIFGYVAIIASAVALYQWPREGLKNKLLSQLAKQKEDLILVGFPSPGSELTAQGLARYLAAVEVELKSYHLAFYGKAALLLAVGSLLLGSGLAAIFFPRVTGLEMDLLLASGALVMLVGFAFACYTRDPGLDRLQRLVASPQKGIFDKIDRKKIIEEEGKKIPF